MIPQNAGILIVKASPTWCLSYKVEEVVDFLMFSSCEAVGGNVEDEIAAW